MAILTNIQLINECKRMAGMNGNLEKEVGKISYYRDRFGYVLGGQGHTYSKALAQQWGNAKRAGKSYNYFVNDCAHWFGRKVVDCSGMIVEAYRVFDKSFGDRTADYFYSSYTTEKGGIKTLPEEIGLIVWKKGHIGVYAGNGRVIEARGYKYGVVVSDLSTQKWTNWGRLKDVDYVKEVEKEETAKKYDFNRVLKYQSVMMRGEDVRALQELLTKEDQSVGAIDGIFGKKTRDAVKSFQRINKLAVDGSAGKNTILALGGTWKGKGKIVDSVVVNPVTWSVSRNLKKGCKGDDVKALQNALIKIGYSCGSKGVDGSFGSSTLSAVKKYQKAKGLVADGIAGKKTITALGGIWKG